MVVRTAGRGLGLRRSVVARASQGAADARSDADRELEEALVGAHHAPAVLARRDVRDDDLGAGDHRGRADAGDEAEDEELVKTAGQAAEHAANAGDDCSGQDDI